MSAKTATRRYSRRDLIRRGGELGVAATAFGGISGCMIPANNNSDCTPPTKPTIGDVAILRFLAAAEIVETDLWDQYCELANNNDAYKEALESIDDDMPAYICDNTADERSHADFLNAYLSSIGAPPVNLDVFRTIIPPTVQGLQAKPRLTNLTKLNVDTSWVPRYLGPGNPDFSDTFAQVVDITNRPTIPKADGLTDDQIRAIAYSAAFHFGAIEQGGTSLYVNMLTRAASAEAVRIVASIGPTEAWHLTIWRDQIGHVGALDTGDGLVFKDFTTDEDIAAHVMPNPCRFLSAALPLCSVIRPSSDGNANATAAAKSLQSSGLFSGQSQAFFDALTTLAAAADAASRG